MHSHHSPIKTRKLSLIVVMTIFLVSTFFTARAQEPPPIDPTPVEPKTPLPGMESLAADLTAATADAYEPDNTVSQLEAGLSAGRDKLLVSGVGQTHSISPVGDRDWVKFQLGSRSSITLETSGPSPLDDTEMWLYNSSLQLLDYNDDKSPNNWHSYIQRCGPTALPAGNYYVRIARRGNDQEIASYNIVFKINPAGYTSCIPNTAVVIGGQTRGSYWVHQETSTRQNYTLNSGPGRVRTLDNVKQLVASIGISLKKTAPYESYSEIIGMPASRLTDTYWFPWYNYASTSGLVTQLCFGNVGSAVTNVTVTIGARTPIVYSSLGINKAKCVSYPGVNTGPVRVKSSGSVRIVASLSTRMKTNASYTSYAEFGGVSASDTQSTDYMFPWYTNSGSTVSQLLFTNIGSSSSTVQIMLHGTVRSTKYTLAPKQRQLISIPNANTGPVHVQSTNGVPISASMIVRLTTAAGYTSYTELMGLPLASMNQTRFVFPWYNNATSGNLVSQLRINNMGTTSTNVTVKIGGVTMPYVSLLRGQSKVVSFANVNNGPVVLQSSGGVPILASMMVYLKKGYSYTSYSEYIGQSGLPANQMAPSAWFPWYSNISTGNFLSNLRFGLPAKP